MVESNLYLLISSSVALQVAGHLFEGPCYHNSPTSLNNVLCCAHLVLLLAEGKAGSLVDEKGHFYKPVQVRQNPTLMQFHQPTSL